MSDGSKPKSRSQGPGAAERPDEALIVDPIKMARARHASAHNQSVVEQARQSSAKKTAAAGPSGGQGPLGELVVALFNGTPGCLLLLIIGLAFVGGAVVGGLVGGGLLIGLLRSGDLAWSGTPTATPTLFVTPTPAPAETMTPTPTIEPTPTRQVEDIIAQIIPSVVTVVNEHNSGLTANPDDSRVVGSGVIIDERGYIATNHHVIENPGTLRVVLADGRSLPADLVVSDPSEDLAVVKVVADNLLAIKIGDSNSVRPGQMVFAIGSPLGDFPNSVSFGVVSGLNRALEMNEFVIDGLIQTDAAINRGSSGGPLVNLHGEMIGINTFIIRESEDRGVAEGIAFALPTNKARDLMYPWISAHSGAAEPIPAAEEPGGN